eukprot:1839573-Amphidinium_carterae.3
MAVSHGRIFIDQDAGGLHLIVKAKSRQPISQSPLTSALLLEWELTRSVLTTPRLAGLTIKCRSGVSFVNQAPQLRSICVIRATQ